MKLVVLFSHIDNLRVFGDSVFIELMVCSAEYLVKYVSLVATTSLLLDLITKYWPLVVSLITKYKFSPPIIYFSGPLADN